MPISRTIRILLRCTPLLAAFALYGYTLRLVLFLDDGFQFNIVQHINGIEQWAGSAAYVYYRPALFSFYKLLGVIAGFYDPLGLHWLNVVFFGMAGVTVGMLARRIVMHQRELVGVLAGLAFVLFPFSYQTVVLVGAMQHLVLALCTALGLWCALAWIDRRRRRSVAALWLLTFWGLFNQENGVLIAPLLVLMLGLVYGRRVLREPLRNPALWAVLPVTGITAVYWVLRSVVPLAPSDSHLQDWENIIQSLATVSQAIIYPAAAFVRRFVQGTPAPLEMFLLLAVVLLPVLIFHVWQARRSRNTQSLKAVGFGLAWYGLGVLPAMLLLDQFYVSGSPRILVFGALGLSIFWAVTVVKFAASGWLGKLLGVGVAVSMVVVSLPFLNGERANYVLLDNYMRRLNELIVNQPVPVEQTRILLVNAPDYLTPVEGQETFLRGTEGAAMMFHTINYDLQIWVNTGILPPVIDTAKFHQIMRADGYSMYAHDPEVGPIELVEKARQYDALYVTQWDGQAFYPVYVGAPDMTGPDEPLVVFGDDQIALTQMDMLYAPRLHALHIRLRWLVNQPEGVQPFVHVLCDGEQVGGADMGVWGDVYGFNFWSPGEVQTDLREIRLNRPFDPAVCQAFLGLYRPADVTRLAALDARASTRYADDMVALPYEGTTDKVFPFGRGDE
ncbi:MAG: hypothetical protein R3E39_21415 [Anaerolineae bacterium]